MLFYNAIESKTFQLLKDLQCINELRDFILVGGTSLALQIGHRISIDIDLFTSKTEIKVSDISELISHLGKLKIVNQSPSILNLLINDIKVDFVVHRYKLLKPCILTDNVKLASIPDIAAMKLSAITGRGAKKDFIDLYFLLESYSLQELIGFYLAKYPDGSEFLLFKSLSYFEDAEIEPMPRMIKQVSWTKVKKSIIAQIKSNFP